MPLASSSPCVGVETRALPRLRLEPLSYPASANGLLLWHTPNNATTTHCLLVPQSPTQPELRMHSTARHMLSSSHTQLRTTVPHIAHSASQLHSQLHRAPPSVGALHNWQRHASSHRHTNLSRHWLRFGPLDRYFYPSVPLPLQSMPKSGVVNFKSLGYNGLQDGRSGQT